MQTGKTRKTPKHLANKNAYEFYIKLTQQQYPNMECTILHFLVTIIHNCDEKMVQI